MQERSPITSGPLGVKAPVRNNYFYGMLLDVYQMNLETMYHTLMRYFNNRFISGHGVICGLDVAPTEDRQGVIITSGGAIDKWGREIIVPVDSGPHLFPPDLVTPPARTGEKEEDATTTRQSGSYVRRKGQADEEREETWIHVVICYYECEGDPTPVMAADCGEGQVCAAGSIYERFRIEFRPGRVDPFPIWDCSIPDVIQRNEMDYPALAEWVTRSCPALDRDPCIPLANIRLFWDDDGNPLCRPDEIDIGIRPIVFTNDVLFRLIMSSIIEAPRTRRSK